MNNFNKLRTPDFEDMWKRLISSKEQGLLISVRQSALKHAYEKSTHVRCYDRWIDAYMKIWFEDPTIVDLIRFE